MNVVTVSDTGVTCASYYPSSDGTVNGSEIHQSLPDDKYKLEGVAEVSYDAIKQMPAWADRSIWSGGVYQKTWHNITAETCITKLRPTNYFAKFARMATINVSGLQIYVPFADATLQECALHVLTQHVGLPFIVNGEVDATPETAPQQVQKDFFPRLTVQAGTTISSAGATCTIQVVDAAGQPLSRNCTAFLETVSGYTPKVRVPIVNGVGTFKVLPLGLDIGDIVRVKVGWKYFTGEAEVNMVVL